MVFAGAGSSHGHAKCPCRGRFERGRCEARRSPHEAWQPNQIRNPAWVVDLLDLPPAAVRLVGDQQTHSTDRQVEVALDAAAVSGVAPRLLRSMVRCSGTERGTGEIPLQLTFSPVAPPRELSLSLGRTAHHLRAILGGDRVHRVAARRRRPRSLEGLGAALGRGRERAVGAAARTAAAAPLAKAGSATTSLSRQARPIEAAGS
jgi:hypothetical protein